MEPDWNELEKRFAGRIVKASDALRCCRAAATRGAGKMGVLTLKLVNGLLDPASWGEAGMGYVETFKPGRQIELRPGKVVVPTYDVEVRGLPLGAAGAVLVGLAMLENLREQEGAWTAAQTLADGIPALVTRARKSAENDCPDCVARSLLPQTAPRRYETARIRRRL